jgi:solute carrier family 5 (sodium-coupled monocarboxylate transporter), member 8/12
LRAVVAFFGALCVFLCFLVEKMGSTILQLSMSLGAVNNGPLLGIFTMGIMMPWVHGTGALVGGTTGLITMAWLCFNAQVAIATGQLKFDTKPVSTAECTYNFISTPAMSMMSSNLTVPFQAER